MGSDRRIVTTAQKNSGVKVLVGGVGGRTMSVPFSDVRDVGDGLWSVRVPTENDIFDAAPVPEPPVIRSDDPVFARCPMRWGECIFCMFGGHKDGPIHATTTMFLNARRVEWGYGQYGWAFYDSPVGAPLPPQEQTPPENAKVEG